MSKRSLYHLRKLNTGYRFEKQLQFYDCARLELSIQYQIQFFCTCLHLRFFTKFSTPVQANTLNRRLQLEPISNLFCFFFSQVQQRTLHYVLSRKNKNYTPGQEPNKEILLHSFSNGVCTFLKQLFLPRKNKKNTSLKGHTNLAFTLAISSKVQHLFLKVVALIFTHKPTTFILLMDQKIPIHYRSH